MGAGHPAERVRACGRAVRARGTGAAPGARQGRRRRRAAPAARCRGRAAARGRSRAPRRRRGGDLPAGPGGGTGGPHHYRAGSDPRGRAPGARTPRRG